MKTPNEWHGMLARLCGVVVKSITGLPEVCAEGAQEIRELAELFRVMRLHEHDRRCANIGRLAHVDRMVPP